MSFKKTELGIIPEEWGIEVIDNIKADEKNAIAMGPFGSNIKKENFVASGIPVLRGNNLKKHILCEDEFIYLTEEKAQKLKASEVKRGDIVITHRGTLGQVSFVPFNSKYDRYIVSQSGMKLTCNQKKVDPMFINYFLNSRIGQYLLLRNKSQVGVPSIASPTTSLKKIPVPVPKLEEQKSIANILSTLDEKIETNNQINKKLEEMSQAIFKQWFVDFEFPNEDGEPYKSSGGEMIESELGMIPIDWKVVTLEEIVDTFNGYSYKGKELSESDNAMITIKNFDRNGGYKIDGLKEIVISDKVKSHHFVEVNDIIVAHTDLTQGAEIIGNPIMVFSKGNYKKLIMSMDTVKVKSKINEISNELLYFILKDYRFKKYALGYVNGTTVLHLSKSTIPQYKIAMPKDKGIMNQLGNNLSSIIKKISSNFKENEKLLSLREVLLPKLMSGEIRVPLECNEN